ncbi:queuosine biosynthesis qued, ptps-i [hydrocarbon metagenome]|uniref:Queuosine biosynthesis qued, ptps-i n=1 Tax=hydrocarbon metagenome TaxID=938273 RepID=A0A0W8G0R5_9ZZZZ
MKISKEFKWEMGHRLPFHSGKCKNIHGHTYKMRVEIEGDLDENGMVIDYYDVSEIISPMVEELDHSFMVKETDKEIIDFLDKLNSKKVVVPFETTAENITLHLLEKIKERINSNRIKRIKVRVYETEKTYAEDEISL